MTPLWRFRRAPVKTLHITNYYHHSSGGIRTFYRALLEAADRNRREVCLVVPGREDSVERVGAFGRIHTIASPRSPFFDSRYRLLLPHLYALPYRSRLREILRQEQPDLIEVCDKYTLCFLPSVLRRGWIDGVTPPVVVGLSCERMDDNVSAFVSPGPLGHLWATWYMKRVYAPRFDVHISNSEYTAAELSEALGAPGRIRVYVCPMGVETGSLRPERRRPDTRRALIASLTPPIPATDATRLLLYAGRISPEKNVGLLLDVMEQLAREPAYDYRLLLAGSGPRAEWVERAGLRVAPGRVYLLGQIAGRERLADIYANCDVLIHPNPREPFGIAPLEAMASGLPVVAPTHGGVRSYANDNNSWLADPTSESFAAAVRQILGDEALRKFKTGQALRTAANFSWSRVTAQFFELYDNLVARPARADVQVPVRAKSLCAI